MRNIATGSISVIALLLCTGALAAAEQEASLGGVSYAAGDWPASGRGNHRAVIEVTAPTAPGQYAVYYLPYQENYSSNGHYVAGNGDRPRWPAVYISAAEGRRYFARTVHARRRAVVRLHYPGDDNAGTWVRDVVIRDGAGQVVFDSTQARRGTAVENTATVADSLLDSLPKARLVRMEWRRRADERPDMNAFYPMEVIASQAELSALAGQHSDPVLLFPEDRTRPVVMPDFLPQKWALEGPQQVFRGTCQPSEYYCWQIGVFATREDVKSLSLEYTDVLNTAGQVVIRGQDITCFNLEGTNNRGERFTKECTLNTGMVRPLWIGLMVPDDTQGELRGAVQVRVNNRAAQSIELVLNVDGPAIPNHGDDEPWRHSRLRWLNSTLGLDDSLLPLPFTPVQRRGTTLEILNRAIDIGDQGLPAKIVSHGLDVLAAPVRIETLDTVLGRTPAVDQRREGGPKSDRRGKRGRVARLHGGAEADRQYAAQPAIPVLRYPVQAGASRSLATVVHGEHRPLSSQRGGKPLHQLSVHDRGADERGLRGDQSAGPARHDDLLHAAGTVQHHSRVVRVSQLG